MNSSSETEGPLLSLEHGGCRGYRLGHGTPFGRQQEPVHIPGAQIVGDRLSIDLSGGDSLPVRKRLLPTKELCLTRAVSGEDRLEGREPDRGGAYKVCGTSPLTKDLEELGRATFGVVDAGLGPPSDRKSVV